MASYWGIFLAVILILIWIVTGGYITQANVYLREFQNTDQFFKTAYNYTFWAAFITWFLVALFILLVILAIVGVVSLFSTGAGEAEAAAAEEQSLSSQLYKQYQNYQVPKEDAGISWTTIVIVIFALILVIITGILAAYSADQIKQSSNFTESNANMKVAYDDCVIAAIICLGAAGLLILSGIIYFFIAFFNIRQSNKVITPQVQAAPLTVTPQTSSVVTTNTVGETPPATITQSNKQLQLQGEFITAKQKELEENFKKGTIVK